MVERKRLLIIIIPCYIIAAYLAYSYIPNLIADTSSRTQSYTLTIDEDSTTYKVGNGKLTFGLDNNQGTKSYIYIYGLSPTNNINEAKFFASDLFDQGGNSISAASSIVVHPTMKPLTPISETPATVELTIQNSKALGNFHGWFMLLIGDEIISVPVTASTDPLYLIALLWVTVGVSVSIGTWELANFLDANRTKQLLDDNSTNAGLIAREKEHQAHLGSFLNIIQFTFVNFFTIVFAIAAFYLALLSNPQVMQLQNISDIDKLTLIGLGLGIGSLSGFINKANKA